MDAGDNVGDSLRWLRQPDVNPEVDLGLLEVVVAEVEQLMLLRTSALLRRAIWAVRRWLGFC